MYMSSVIHALRSRVRFRTRIRDFGTRIREVADPLRPCDKLTKLCNKYRTDKGDRTGCCHGYAAIYHTLFEGLSDKEISVCEIGLWAPSDRDGSPWARLTYDRPLGVTEEELKRTPSFAAGETAKAPSLRVWRDYFPRAKLFGFDIDDFSTVKIPNCTIVRGDSSSREDLRGLGDLGPFDIVIEDASHASHHQQITLAALFPSMKSGGLFCIEDLHVQPKYLEPKDAPKTRDVIRNGYQSPYIQDSEAAFLRANVKSVRFFDSNDKFNEDSYDALAIIERG